MCLGDTGAPLAYLVRTDFSLTAVLLVGMVGALSTIPHCGLVSTTWPQGSAHLWQVMRYIYKRQTQGNLLLGVTFLLTKKTQSPQGAVATPASSQDQNHLRSLRLVAPAWRFEAAGLERGCVWKTLLA